MNELIFKRFHPLAVEGGWVVCDGNIIQKDHTKNTIPVAIDGQKWDNRESCLAVCETLNSQEAS